MDRTEQGNLIRCTPVLDERYVPGTTLISVNGRQGGRWHTLREHSYAMPRRARAQGIWFPTSPSFSRLDPWSWERPSVWGLVDGWDCERVTGAGVMGITVIANAVVQPLFALGCLLLLVKWCHVVLWAVCGVCGCLFGRVVDGRRVRKRHGRILQLHDNHRHSSEIGRGVHNRA